MMAEAAFLHAALRYCDVKVRQVDLNRLIRLAPCSEDGGGPIEGYEATPPCWFDLDEGVICLDEACSNCQATYPLLEQRRALGKQIPNLAKKMYALYRLEVAGIEGT